MPKQMTAKAKTIAALEALGYRLDVTARTSKYKVYRLNDLKFLIGKSGALRKTEGSIASSISLTDSRFHKCLQQLGEDAEHLSSLEQAYAHLESLMRS